MANEILVLLLMIFISMLGMLLASFQLKSFNKSNKLFDAKTVMTKPFQFMYHDFNHTIWDNVLKRHVSHATLGGTSLNVVDYVGVRKDPEFYNYLEMLSQWPHTVNMSLHVELALFINAYNAYAIKMVADNPCKVRFGRYCYPVKSIWDIGSFGTSVWKMKTANVGGTIYSLDEIETRLRNLQDPRIHACIVCASVSCPNLRPEAYTHDKVEYQMNSQVHQFLANSNKGFALDENTETIFISPIFEWYKQDFETYMKQHYNGTALDFIITNVPKQYQTYLLKHQLSLSIEHLNYDWRLNSLASTNTIRKYTPVTVTSTESSN